MRWLNFNCIIAFFICTSIILSPLNAQEKYEKIIENYHNRWRQLIPKHFKMHFAGSMGLFSAGIGWDYGKRDQWETDIMFGFLPRFSTSKAKMTFTLKQNLMPWYIDIGKSFFIDPLSCGLYITTVFSEHFWLNLPDKYPNSYYPFSTKLRINFYIGRRITYEIDGAKRNHIKALSFFYELHTNELYIFTAIKNRYLKPTDIMRLSFGVKMNIL